MGSWIFPFCFPAVLFLRLQVWRRRKHLAGKIVLRLIQIHLTTPSFAKISPACQVNSPQAPCRFVLWLRDKRSVRGSKCAFQARGGRPLQKRKCQFDSCAATDLALNTGRAAVQIDNGLHQSETEACPIGAAR